MDRASSVLYLPLRMRPVFTEPCRIVMACQRRPSSAVAREVDRVTSLPILPATSNWHLRASRPDATKLYVDFKAELVQSEQDA